LFQVLGQQIKFGDKMAVKVNQVELLQEYFLGVVARSEHHAPNVSEVIYPLLGLIVLTMDADSDIQVRGSKGAIGNMLWFTKNSQRYAFRYEHEDDTIEIRKNSFKGDMVAKVSNATTIAVLKGIFDRL
tara:strand:- start:5742 stop:6128 length:387 start_codon:yes stop_codon:yes gene_type:complete